MSPSPSRDDAVVHLPGMLPLDVASTLMRLIGAAYPNATLTAGNGMRLVIPARDRAVDETVFERAAALRVEADEQTVDATVGFGHDGDLRVTLPEQLGRHLVGMVEATMAQFPDAVNYLEIPLQATEDPSRRWVVLRQRARPAPVRRRD